MKILVLINDLKGGGAQRVVQTLTRDWSGRGHEVLVVTLDTGVDYALSSDVEHLTLPLKSFSVGPFKLPMLVVQTAAFVRTTADREPDVVLSFLPRANLVNIMSANLGPARPALISERTMTASLYAESGLKGAVMGWLVARLYPLADRAVCLSEQVSRAVVDLGLEPDRVATIQNPQDIDLIRQRSRHGSAGVASDRFVVSVGRLVKQKDYPTLLRAFERLLRRLDIDLVIVGEGPERDRLESLSTELGVRERVHFTGWIDNPFPTMAGAEAFVLSSNIEGFGNVIVEAMALGLPVVCTDSSGGPGEILEGGRYGLLVPAGDHEALGEALVTLLQDEELRGWYRQRSRERARDFDVDVISPRFLDLMERAVSDRAVAERTGGSFRGGG